MSHIKIGFAPTRRSFFSAPDAIKYRGLTAERLRELGVDFVDIDDINEEGLLYDENDRLKIVEKFKKEKIDGLFLPHCNFGTEYECARLAKELNVPVLLWSPLDERPEPNGVRLRDTQCGLFATGKVLRRFGVPFTYLTNCRLNGQVNYVLEGKFELHGRGHHVAERGRLPHRFGQRERAACAAGFSYGLYDPETIFANTHRSCFTPEMDNTEREARYNGWQKAVRQALTH